MQAAVSHVLGPAEGDFVQLLALGVRFMVDGETRGGAFSLVEHPRPPRALGAPVHTHRNEDEYSYVVDGRIGVQLGDEVLEAGPESWCSSRGAFRTPSGMPATSLHGYLS